jgi:hypothetical protein
MTKTEKEYRRFEADVIATPPLRMILTEVPAPDPIVRTLRQKQVEARRIFLQNSDLLERLIAYMAKQD